MALQTSRLNPFFEVVDSMMFTTDFTPNFPICRACFNIYAFLSMIVHLALAVFSDSQSGKVAFFLPLDPCILDEMDEPV